MTITSLRWHCSRACHRAPSSCRPWGSRFSRTVPLNKKGSWGMTASWDLGTGQGEQAGDVSTFLWHRFTYGSGTSKEIWG